VENGARYDGKLVLFPRLVPNRLLTGTENGEIGDFEWPWTVRRPLFQC